MEFSTHCIGAPRGAPSGLHPPDATPQGLTAYWYRRQRFPRIPSPRFEAHSCDTLLQPLPQGLEDVASELRPFIQGAHAGVRPRPLAWHGEVPTADQPHIRDRMMGSATRGAVPTAARGPVGPATRSCAPLVLWRGVLPRAPLPSGVIGRAMI